MNRKSVLIVHARDLTFPFGSTFAHYVTKRLSESHTVHVVCRRRPEYRDECPGSSDVIYHDFNTGEIPILSGVLFAFVSTAFSVLLAARHRYDVVYSFKNTLLQGYLAALFGGSSLVAGLQSVPVQQARELWNDRHSQTIQTRVTLSLYAGYSTVFGSIIKNASEVICLTSGIREVTEELYGIDLSGAHVIGMGVDLERFSYENAGGNMKSPSDTWTVTYLGTVHGTRGLDHVLEGIAETDYDVVFRIVGSGPDTHVASLKRRANELGVSDRVDWVGLVSHDAVPEVLRSTDIAVSPLADIESYRISFPAKLLEYMAASCVIIATDIPPHRRLIDDEKNGILYDGSTSGFTDALASCIKGPDLSMRREARRTAEQHGWDDIVRKHEEVVFSES